MAMPNPAMVSLPPDVLRLIDAARAHIDAGRIEAARPIYERLVGLSPENADLHHTLGLVCLETGRCDQAAMHIGRAVELNPTNDAAYRSLGDALAAAGQFPLAIRAYEKACTLNPGNTDALLNLGNLFHELDLFDRAEHAFTQILSSAPGHMQALNNLGKLCHDTGRLGQALDFYDECLSRHPQHAQAQFNRAALLLAMGDYRRGWAAYEWRFRRPGAASVYPHRLSSPRWQGEDFQGRRLLVHCEQGMGDVLQFMRYLPWVKQSGGEVVVEVHPPLVPLLELQPDIDAVIAFDAQQPPAIPHDLHIPLLSLPGLFHAGSDAIPNALPYIETGHRNAHLWKSHIRQDLFNIGLVWASSDTNPKRNLPLDRCRAWFQNPKLHFISLQKGRHSEDIAALQGERSPVTVLGHHLHSFLDTAGIISHLDLVISVDTAAIHLAGGMAMPLWALLPFSADWRWPRKGERSKWYPHAEIFRQSVPGHWDDAIAMVAAKLQDLNSN
jgi:Flp pilus assembly protein TadD